ncbi:TlpA family protein disulfide reductase [Natronospira bacteriovora]|uniref:TlpA disulfide reductase family protein n=1 Tax=Natronospira bacteriovora TaxID=3069753 RepID=A0ABU0W6L2_9GAMM|nr:TlpA disulfide reductase family protein [Natronospira sp. AB-CW4]MDQ2069636.1 TlpA disulfide reductase family protein [Natronospira sp. AB-CW4]
MNRHLPALLIAVMLAAGALGFGLYHWLNPGSDPLPAEASGGTLAETMPEFSMPDPDGEERHSSEWDGDILVVNFWGTWCAPCREEVPLLIEMQENYGDQGLTVLGIALDQVEPVQRFADDFGINYPLLVGEQETLAVMESFGSGTVGMPHTFVVDRDGRIVNFHVGLIEEHEVEALLAPALRNEAGSDS